MNFSKVVLVASAYFMCSSAQGAPLWTRAMFATRSHDRETSVLTLYVVKQEGLHLTGECSYFQPEGRTPAAAVIAGTDAGDAGFWPDVTAQVKNEATGKWETIAQPFNHGHRAKVEIKAGENRERLPVALDVFLPLINRYKLGRLVLSTGEMTTFELEMLLEPGFDSSRSD